MSIIGSLVAIFVACAVWAAPAWAFKPPMDRPDTDMIKEALVHHILRSTKPGIDRIHRKLLRVPPARLLSEFRSVAMTDSEDPGSAPEGGLLGMVFEGQMVEEFEQVIFNLPEGKMSAPFKTAFGWHVVIVENVGERRIASICSQKLYFEQFKLPEADREALQFTFNLKEGEDIHPAVLSHIGYDWHLPIKDWNGDLMYVRTRSVADADHLKEIELHTEYVRPMFNPHPEGCRRSARRLFAANCSTQQVKELAYAEYEGRAAAGRKLQPHPKSTRPADWIDAKGYLRQLTDMACGTMPLHSAFNGH